MQLIEKRMDSVYTEKTIPNNHLQEIAKNTIIIFLGTIFGMLFSFFSRTLMAKSFSTSEFGMFSLAFVILQLFMISSTLGLKLGSTRQIAYYLGKNNSEKVKGVITSSIQMVIFSSVLMSLILYFTSEMISIKIFNEVGLIIPLKIVSITIPFFVLLGIFSSIFRGFNNTKPGVIFENIFRNGLFFLFIVIIIIFGLTFSFTIYSIMASYFITCFVFAFYFKRNIPLSVNMIKEPINISNYKKLLSFSLPLCISYILGTIIAISDTLMIGYFNPSADVGIYSACMTIAPLISIILTSVVFIYVPIISQLYAKNLLGEIKRTYAVLTKWTYSITFPFFIIIILFPNNILNFFFGMEYTIGIPVLQILAFVFFTGVFVGPQGATLVSLGETKYIMWVNLFGVIINLTLNFYLIPLIGIIGAAIASLSSVVIVVLLYAIKLFLFLKIHPFTKNYIKSISLSTSLTLITIYLIKIFFKINTWHLIIIFFIAVIIYGLSLFITKSLDDEDVNMLLMIERKSGLNLTIIKKILKKII